MLRLLAVGTIIENFKQWCVLFSSTASLYQQCPLSHSNKLWRTDMFLPTPKPWCRECTASSHLAVSCCIVVDGSSWKFWESFPVLELSDTEFQTKSTYALGLGHSLDYHFLGESDLPFWNLLALVVLKHQTHVCQQVKEIYLSAHLLLCCQMRFSTVFSLHPCGRARMYYFSSCQNSPREKKSCRFTLSEVAKILIIYLHVHWQ